MITWPVAKALLTTLEDPARRLSPRTEAEAQAAVLWDLYLTLHPQLPDMGPHIRHTHLDRAGVAFSHLHHLDRRFLLGCWVPNILGRLPSKKEPYVGGDLVCAAAHALHDHLLLLPDAVWSDWPAFWFNRSTYLTDMFLVRAPLPPEGGPPPEGPLHKLALTAILAAPWSNLLLRARPDTPMSTSYGYATLFLQSVTKAEQRRMTHDIRALCLAQLLGTFNAQDSND